MSAIVTSFQDSQPSGYNVLTLGHRFYDPCWVGGYIYNMPVLHHLLALTCEDFLKVEIFVLIDEWSRYILLMIKVIENLTYKWIIFDRKKLLKKGCQLCIKWKVFICLVSLDPASISIKLVYHLEEISIQF